MEFRDLKKQYQVLKEDIDQKVLAVMDAGNYINGPEVGELEQQLSDYTGAKHTIACANGTDALQLVLMAWNIGEGDAVFVPNFTFFSSGEVVSAVGATPVFVDTDPETFNMNPASLKEAIKLVKQTDLIPKVVMPVDLFGQPANYPVLEKICLDHDLLMLGDGAQGFGGSINNKLIGSFGDAATTSFFPAKPLGCYGDGGAIFTDDDELALKLRSLAVHGKGTDKYDNVAIGMNSRLDTMQAAILQVKLKAFIDYELKDINKIAHLYTANLNGFVQTPKVKQGYTSSWAQYTVLLPEDVDRDILQVKLSNKGIPTNIYYPKTMDEQTVYQSLKPIVLDLSISKYQAKKVLSLPIDPYMTEEEVSYITSNLIKLIR